MPFAAENFRIEFEYKIHGRGISLFGDGFAFWFTQTKGTVGPVLGSNDKWNGLGIIFDTYDNGNHGYTYPYVNGVLNDGTKTYNKDTDGKELSIGGCEADIRDRPFTTRARIKYFKGKYISLELNTKGWDEWVECFKVPNVKLPDTGYMGFSAETGGLSDNHDIITISTHTLNSDGASSESSDPTKQKSTMSSDSYFGSLDTSSGPSYLLIFFAISGIGAVAYFGFQYVTRTERNKRF
ncbi:legume-like lectin family-domain-containing protein [Paraphysoderma sedebokerense]|nr:legume-like lectin family-domain-containing protein [Paraphysoderma sedebokerense]